MFVAAVVALLATGCAVGAGFVVGRRSVGRLFSRDLQVVHLASEISVLVGAFYVVLCLMYASAAALGGQGRQATIAGAMLVGSWAVATPLCRALAFSPGHLGVVGIWWGFVAG